MRVTWLCVGVVVLLAGVQVLCADPPKDNRDWWSEEVGRALERAGDNRPELVTALRETPAEQRKCMAFLIANMSDADLKKLRASFLLDNVALAARARKEMPWGRKVPEEIFLEYALPYANVDEERHAWRKELYELCLPMVKGCKTPADAAQRLNAELFKKVKVRYSTEREKPQQSPQESMASGMASCTGLSILLADACRSVAVPARLVGTPLWKNRSGNHTWVEVWDGGWHFTGACEADPHGLDHAWFESIAAEALADSRLHAIYAARFRRTQTTFPLVWNPRCKDVCAENVTARYTRTRPGLKADQRRQIEKAARDYFAASLGERARWRFDAGQDGLLPEHEEEIRDIVWKAYLGAPIHSELKKDFDNKQVRYEKHRSPYTVKQVGKKPPKGWPLFIAMHGGGGAPAEVNDSQWKIMQIYYRDQPAVGGYQYLALRAPNNTWNGFYDDYVPPLIINLIRQTVLFGDVDPDRVYLMGYSHGGYGAFFIGPKIPDRFAVVHSSAAAPTDGAISARTLRNTRFTFMVGDKDNDYGRRERCEAFDRAIRKLREENKGDYPVELELKKGFGHGGLPDRDKIKDMAPFTRNPVPRRLSWDLTDPVVTHFYWLSVPRPGKGQSIDAVLHDNKAEITTRNVDHFELCLDSRLVDFRKPLRIEVDGKKETITLRPQLAVLCRSLEERGDPRLACTCRVGLQGGKKSKND
jgi:hypothetical protein